MPLAHRWLNPPEGAFLDPGDSWAYLGQQNEAGRCSQALIQGIPSPGYAAVTPVLSWTRGLYKAATQTGGAGMPGLMMVPLDFIPLSM